MAENKGASKWYLIGNDYNWPRDTNAAAKGYIDSVIEPEETRRSLLHALEVSGEKSVGMPAKKHGIPPF